MGAATGDTALVQDVTAAVAASAQQRDALCARLAAAQAVLEEKADKARKAAEKKASKA